MVSGWRAAAVAAALAFVTLSGCAASDEASTSTTQAPAQTTTTTPPPAPVHRGPAQPRYVGTVAPPSPARFWMPDVHPGKDWNRVELRADMPAGSWLFVYMPLPASHRLVEGDFQRELVVAGAGNATGPAGRLVAAPFLVIDEAGARGPEVQGFEVHATHDPSGAEWTYTPGSAAIPPFGDAPYAGIALVAGANTAWRLNLTLVAPWEGNLTVGPEQITWGMGFTSLQLPPMVPEEPPGTTSRLEWSRNYAPGWLAATADSGCPTAAPCADAVREESWTFQFPGGALVKRFERTAYGGLPPSGHFGLVQSPPGTLAVTGQADGLPGTRTVHVHHLPIPASTWPFALDATTYSWPPG